MTVATKGVPLANAVANVLNVPFCYLLRRDLKITERFNCQRQLLYQVQVVTALRKCSFQNVVFKAGSRVLIVDDFLKGGGTVNGMISLLA